MRGRRAPDEVGEPLGDLRRVRRPIDGCAPLVASRIERESGRRDVDRLFRRPGELELETSSAGTSFSIRLPGARMLT